MKIQLPFTKSKNKEKAPIEKDATKKDIGMMTPLKMILSN